MHLSDDGQYDVYVHKHEDNIIRVKIQSRHVSSKVYNLWIEYNVTEITGWYCQCRSGARTVGCCAHIASVVWYLGYRRHQDAAFQGPASSHITHIEDAGEDSDQGSEWEEFEDISSSDADDL